VGPNGRARLAAESSQGHLTIMIRNITPTDIGVTGFLLFCQLSKSRHLLVVFVRIARFVASCFHELFSGNDPARLIFMSNCRTDNEPIVGRTKNRLGDFANLIKNCRNFGR
jgi:hypothetical protein